MQQLFLWMKMVYINRDDKGKIIGVSSVANNEQHEALSMANPEVLAFLLHTDKEHALDFIHADLQFIRVIEDLIDILLNKNIINITDFPVAVIDKLLSRQSIRKRINQSSGLELNEDDALI